MGRTIQRVAVAVLMATVTLACSPNVDGAPTEQELVGNWSAASPPARTMGGYWWSFDTSGRARNYDGCNWTGGSYSVESGRLVMIDVAGTTRACRSADGEPAGLALADPATVRVVNGGRTLVLATSIGEVRLDRVAEVPRVE